MPKEISKTIMVRLKIIDLNGNEISEPVAEHLLQNLSYDLRACCLGRGQGSLAVVPDVVEVSAEEKKPEPQILQEQK